MLCLNIHASFHLKCSFNTNWLVQSVYSEALTLCKVFDKTVKLLILPVFLPCKLFLICTMQSLNTHTHTHTHIKFLFKFILLFNTTIFIRKGRHILEQEATFTAAFVNMFNFQLLLERNNITEFSHRQDIIVMSNFLILTCFQMYSGICFSTLLAYTFLICFSPQCF